MNERNGRMRFWIVLLAALGLLAVCNPALAEAGIPVVTITGENLEGWTGKADVRDAVLTYRDAEGNAVFSEAIRISPQGTSSLNYSKKNFTIKFQNGGVEVREDWGSQVEYCLKANYINPTQACNVVSARLAAQMNAQYGLFESAPNRCEIDGFPIWVVLNEQPAGLYTWNIPKDAWAYGMDGDNENEIAMFAENWEPACVFMADNFTMGEEWTLEAGPDDLASAAKFTRLLKFVCNSTEEEFKANLDQYLNLDACLNYYCFINIAQGFDNEAKNMLMITYDGKVWYPVLYDLDSLYRIDWKGDAIYDNGVLDILHGENNALFNKLKACFGDEMHARYAELRSTVLSRENIRAAFEDFAAGIPQEYYDMDRQLWNSDGHLIRSYDLMFQLMDQYLPILDEAFGFSGDAASAVPQTESTAA